MKVALVYDRVNKFGGAERVLLALHEIWPEAPLFTAVYNPKTACWAGVFKVIPSFLNKFPLAKTNHEIYVGLAPIAFESFDFSDFDVVISVTSAEAKGIITKPSTFHICYCLTPTRYLWSGEKDYFANPGFGGFNFLARVLIKPLFSYLKKWDKIACFRPDCMVAISKNVQARIKKYYGRESDFIYPLVGIKMNQEGEVSSAADKDKERYFLIVSRLVSYKKVDLAVGVFNKLGWRLKIVGVGREMGRLKKMAKGNVEFLGELTDEALLGYYQGCAALIMVQEEDFGLVAVEAQSTGKPVIAYRKGGAAESVIDGKTGILFGVQSKEGLLQGLRKFERMEFSAKACRQNAARFAKEVFKKEFKRLVLSKYREFKEGK